MNGRFLVTHRPDGHPGLTLELGAGTSERTRLLLDAMSEHGRLERFVLFDVGETTLRATAEAVADEYPELDVSGVVGDFRRHLGRIPANGRRLVAFLGGTIGNLRPAEPAALLAELAAAMDPGGDDIRTAISAKFRPARVRAELPAAGLQPVGWWTDPADDYAVSLAVR
jgi:L-histidine N-alpha-methyltransferase